MVHFHLILILKPLTPLHLVYALVRLYAICRFSQFCEQQQFCSSCLLAYITMSVALFFNTFTLPLSYIFQLTPVSSDFNTFNSFIQHINHSSPSSHLLSRLLTHLSLTLSVYDIIIYQWTITMLYVLTTSIPAGFLISKKLSQQIDRLGVSAFQNGVSHAVIAIFLNLL